MHTWLCLLGTPFSFPLTDTRWPRDHPQRWDPSALLPWSAPHLWPEEHPLPPSGGERLSEVHAAVGLHLGSSQAAALGAWQLQEQGAAFHAQLHASGRPRPGGCQVGGWRHMAALAPHSAWAPGVRWTRDFPTREHLHLSLRNNEKLPRVLPKAGFSLCGCVAERTAWGRGGGGSERHSPPRAARSPARLNPFRSSAGCASCTRVFPRPLRSAAQGCVSAPRSWQ